MHSFKLNCVKKYIKLAFSLAIAVAGVSTVFAQDTLRLKKYAGKLRTLDVSIGGQIYRFLFDTGGGETFISPSIAHQLGKEVYGSVTGLRMNGDIVKAAKCDSVIFGLGHTSIGPVSVLVWDIMSIIPADLPRLDGIISLKTLQGKKISISLKDEWIILETDRSFRKKVRNAATVPIRMANGLTGNELNMFVEVKRHRSYWFLFDSGNIDRMIISPATASGWGYHKDSLHQESEFSGEEVYIGTEKSRVQGRISSILYDGVLDYDFISQKTYYIDLKNNIAWKGRSN